MFPMLASLVIYRGRQGLKTLRTAVVTANANTLDPRGVEQGMVPGLTDDLHCHLWVFTPAASGPNAQTGGFGEFDVPYGGQEPGELPPGHWCWPADL